MEYWKGSAFGLFVFFKKQLRFSSSFHFKSSNSKWGNSAKGAGWEGVPVAEEEGFGSAL